MPYIEFEARRNIANGFPPETPGELNYCITRTIDEYLENKDERLRYVHINEVIGVLECAKLELYRHIAGPYEDKAREKNGDVYTVGVE